MKAFKNSNAFDGGHGPGGGSGGFQGPGAGSSGGGFTVKAIRVTRAAIINSSLVKESSSSNSQVIKAIRSS